VAHRLRLLPALVAGLVAAAPAAAQQAPAQALRLVLPAPSDPEWPPDGAPPSRDSQDRAWSGREPAFDCGRELPCRVRLRGVLGGNNGGIAVEGTAFIW
jgi:hypothetical protein